MAISEDFLHYLWKFRLFTQQGLRTISGEPIEILNVGVHNKHAGPDFENSLIRIGDTLWAGNVEIHLSSSDWEHHQHQTDKAYDNVILHVVAKHDLEIFRIDGTRIPVLSLEQLIPRNIADNYLNLVESMDWIPCSRHIAKVDSFHTKAWLCRVEAERLEEKAELINEVLAEFKGSWDDAFYIFLARNFGFKTNSIPFEMLARSLPRQLLARYKNKPVQIEALLFGQAGFLSQIYRDEYPIVLKNEYDFLRKKHSLKPLDNYLWKHMRMRPVNFPTIRIAQFAALIIRTNHLFSGILSENSTINIITMFNNLPVNKYWESHYRFDIGSVPYSPALGAQSVANILINTVAVFMMSYGKRTGSSDHINRSLALLESLPPETNAIIERFREIGVEPDSAFFSQSLIQLKKAYCDRKKCLSCGIGVKLLNI